MEIKISTQKILKILLVLAWIIFIGLSIEACAFIVNAIVTLSVNSADAHYFWREVDLSALYRFDSGYFLVEILLMIIPALMKATMFYLIVKILHNKKLNMAQPFNQETGRFIFSICYLSLGIGLFSEWGAKYAKWFTAQGVVMPDIQQMGISGGDVWLFMSVILFVIAQVFKRGIEIQAENELTV